MSLLSRATLAQGLSCKPSELLSGKRARGSVNGDEPCPKVCRALVASTNVAHVAVSYLSVVVNGMNTQALVDSAASDCFVRPEFVNPGTKCEAVQYIVKTAQSGATMIVRQACELPLEIEGHTENVRFLVCNSWSGVRPDSR